LCAGAALRADAPSGVARADKPTSVQNRLAIDGDRFGWAPGSSEYTPRMSTNSRAKQARDAGGLRHTNTRTGMRILQNVLAMAILPRRLIQKRRLDLLELARQKEGSRVPAQVEHRGPHLVKRQRFG
jgi:hypothetical protein